MRPDDSFDAWLNNRHGKMVTPRPLVNAFVEKAVNSPVASAERLIVGQDNEVYDVTTADNQQIIVRISHKEDPRFEAERWALDAARTQGVPTPRVFLVEKTVSDDKSITFCIEEKLPGTPLETLLKNGAERPEQAIRQLGEILSRIHRVTVQGFGYLQPNGSGWPIPFSAIMLDLLEQEEKLQRSAQQWGVPQATVTQGLTLLADNTALYQWNQPSLTHGDFCPAHVLIHENRITGVIDFQECSGNHPVFDFVHWDSHWGHAIPLTSLTVSYQNKTVFDENFEPLFHLVLLRQSLWMLMVRVEHENPHGIDVYKQGIENGLRFFAPS